MATPIRLRPSLLPQCSACTQRLTNAGLDGYSNRFFQQQVRGKKKASNIPSTLTVRLLKPVETFGKAGAYVPIAVGKMRNDWFPRRIAEYVTSAALKDLHARNVPIERDFEAGLTPLKAKKVASDSSAVAAPAAQKAKAIEVERLSVTFPCPLPNAPSNS
ncbi:hypothetical protein LTR04_007202 [Oleoguttula sp. CCFEE 6159]|nr:hypothetical protein LTR04_007202 [Oleoguttula sp. CCFEE 6159]